MEQRNGFNYEETMRKQGGEADISTTYDGKNDKVEQSKVEAMRNFAEKHDPSTKDVDNLTLRRFLRARDQDVEKAATMFLKYLAWKRTFIPNGQISIHEIQNEIAQNKLFMQGFDKQGRPITVILGSKHFQNKKGGVDELKRFAVFALEKICSRMPPGQEKFVVIADLKGWGYSNCDIRGMLGSLSILQDCYPERLGKLYIVHVPYVFMKAWKIVYPFIDNNTKRKIVFVENKQMKATLLEDIEESQLPQTYGGKLPLIPIQEC